MKPGILLAAFGSGSRQGESALRRFEMRVRTRFPDVAVRWAFTSGLMRERLASARKKSDSVCKALDKMAFERFTHVAVQPLHVISGLEYSDILADAEQLQQRKGFAVLTVGAPLLTDPTADEPGMPTPDSCVENSSLEYFQNDILKRVPFQKQSALRAIDLVAEAMLEALPTERCSDEAVLFMGHGTRHAAEQFYESLFTNVQARDPLVFMGTLNGTLRLEHMLPRLLTSAVRRVWLMPFLALVGRHTLEDMAGSSERSWLSRLQAEHIPCVPVLKGMIEHQGFAAIWIEHLAHSMREWE